MAAKHIESLSCEYEYIDEIHSKKALICFINARASSRARLIFPDSRPWNDRLIIGYELSMHTFSLLTEFKNGD